MAEIPDFKRFFLDNYPRFYSFASQFVSDAETCRDIVSDAFEYAWLNRSRPEITNLSSYVFSFIHNKCVNHLRHEKVKRRYADLCQQMYRDPTSGNPVDIDDRIRRMHEILDAMPQQTRTVFTLCYVEKKRYKEVAAQLDISTSTVQKHIVRALRLLRQGLKNVD